MAITYIGSTLEVSAAAYSNNAPSAANIAAAAGVNVGKVISIGEVGDTAEDVSFDLLEGGRRTHVNGVRDIGDIEVTCEFDNSDTGQNRIRTLANTNTTTAFSITDTDGRTTNFFGVVANYRETERNANSYKGCMFTMRGQSAIYRA